MFTVARANADLLEVFQRALHARLEKRGERENMKKKL